MSRNLPIIHKRLDLNGALSGFLAAKVGETQGESINHGGEKGEYVNREKRHTEEKELERMDSKGSMLSAQLLL